MLTPVNTSASPPGAAARPQQEPSGGVSPARRIQPKLRPFFGQLTRFVGLLALAAGWIKLCLLGSNEFFGEKATYDELMLGGQSADVDMGFGGDYLGWGELDLDFHAHGQQGVALDFVEVADMLEELVKVWNAAVSAWPLSWNGTFGPSALEGLLSFVTEQELETLVGSRVSPEDLLPWGSDFDPRLFLNLGKWLAVETSKAGSPRPLKLLSALSAPEDLLLKPKPSKPPSPSKAHLDVKKGTTRPGNRNRKLFRPWTWLRKAVADQEPAPQQQQRKPSGAKPVSRRSSSRSSSSGGGGSKKDDEKEKEEEEEEEEEEEVPGAEQGVGVQEGVRRSRAVSSLRLSLREQWPSIEADAASSGFALDDAQLSRYLEVSNWEPDRASKPGNMTVADMLHDTVAWRVRDSVGKVPLARLLRGAQSGQVYVNGFDTAGHAAVLYTPTDDASGHSVDDLVHFLVYNLELALSLGAQGASPTGQQVFQYTFLVDLSLCGARPPFHPVKAAFEVMGRHYPLRPHKVLLLNGGSMIQWIWRVLEPLVEERTREKVSIVSSSEQAKVLGALFDPSQLERRFHGGANNFVFDPEEYLDTHGQPLLSSPPRKNKKKGNKEKGNTQRGGVESSTSSSFLSPQSQAQCEVL